MARGDPKCITFFREIYVEKIEAEFHVNTMGKLRGPLSQPDNASLADEDPKLAYEGVPSSRSATPKEQFVPFLDDDAPLPDVY